MKKDKLYKFKFRDASGMLYVSWAINGISCYKMLRSKSEAEFRKINATEIPLQEHDAAFSIQSLYNIGIYIDVGSNNGYYHSIYDRDKLKEELKRRRFCSDLEELLV